MQTKWRHRLGLPLVLVFALAFTAALPAAAALAQSAVDDPTAAVYGDDDGSTASFESSGGGGESAGGGLSDPIGSLPFTGIDLIILVGVALVLTGTGFALRRASMHRGQA